MDADVVIAGAGIAGITSAYFLQEAGYKVIVLEEKTIASGATGQSTGVLWYGSGLNLVSSIQKFGKKMPKSCGRKATEPSKRLEK